MGVGPSPAAANDMLDAFDKSGSPLWAQMHIDDPGGDGTSNVAIFEDRASLILPSATDAVRSVPTVITWPNVWSGGEQTVTHLTFWDAEVDGNFRGSLILASPALGQDGFLPRLTIAAVVMLGVASD